MAKKRTKTSNYSSRSKSDNSLMLLAGAAAVIVGFFAVVTYKSKSPAVALPTPVPVVINLDSQNNSYESGTAAFQEVDGKVVVTLALTGFTKAVAQPAHIHVGKCPNPGAVKYALTSVTDGKSETTIDTTLEELKSMGPLAINVHKSASQITSYVSCGDLKL